MRDTGALVRSFSDGDARRETRATREVYFK